MITNEQKAEVRALVQEGKEEDALRYLTTKFSIDRREAQSIVDHIADDLGITIEEDSNRGTKIVKAKKKRNSIGLIIGIAFSLVGIGLLILSFYLFKADYNITNSARKVIGVVAQTPSSPLIEYQLDGEYFYFQSEVSSDPPSYELGEEVELLVNDENSNEVVLNTFTERWLGLTIVTVLGVIFTLVGLTTLFFSRN